eukprot:GDKJ01020402.1.p1 GENE.GDKJ01020402.1~~GDKJ01020402.1.p1  ORF type:complete len:331 (+),score=75.85 GDKJ01020402.1:89-994(+)
MDYYGKRLATASGDHTVRVWDITREQPVLVAKLEGHESPVWEVSWAHPKFGSLLASCSFDRRVIIWKEQNGTFVPAFVHNAHESSVNSVAFAPVEFGLHLACGSSDGHISILSYSPSTSTWSSKMFAAHPSGVNSVSWGTSVGTGSAKSEYPPTDMRLVSGGCDNAVRFWSNTTGEFVEDMIAEKNVHKTWVRDVAWRPITASSSIPLAVSACEGGIVAIWTFDGAKWCLRQKLTPAKDLKNDDDSFKQQSENNTSSQHQQVWKISWSATGSILACAVDDSHVVMYRENLAGVFEKTNECL